MESLVLYGFGEWLALSGGWTVIGLICDVSMDNFWSAIVLVCGGSVDDDDDDAVEVVEDVVDKLLLVLVFLMHVGHSCGSCCRISVSGDIEMSAIMPLSKRMTNIRGYIRDNIHSIKSYWKLPIDNWLTRVVERWCLLRRAACIGVASLISSRPMFAPPLRAEWLPLLEADVLVLIEELLVPDENDEPNEMIELGRRVDFTSGSVPEKEFLNLGAIWSEKTTILLHR